MKQEIQATTIKSSEGKLTAIASTEDKDRAGDVLLVKNWDFSRFKMNPVLQAGHDYRPQYTIGKAENLRVEDNKVLFDPVFHEITPLARQIKQMYEEGFLNAWSVGFIPGSSQLKGEANGTLNELLEVSAVAVPANAFALMKGFEMGEAELETEIKNFVEGSDGSGEAVVEAEVTPEVAEVKELAQISTGETDSHKHLASFDSETGDGSTDDVDGHVHEILNFEVQEANNHTHTLDVDVEQEGYGMGGKKPKKKKEVVERWNKQFPAVFNKQFEVESIDNIRMSFSNEIFTKFFDCEVKNLFVNSFSIPSPLTGTYLSAFVEVTKDFELADTRNWYGDMEYPPLYEVIKLNSTESSEFLLEGIQFFKVAGKNRVAIKFDVGWSGVQASIITDNSNRSWNKELLEKTHKWSQENNYLKGEKFALSGEFIPQTNKTWGDVILDKSIKDIVQRNVTKVSEVDSKSRGLLFVGPPGTGKTMTGKIMMSESKSTFIWVSAKDMWRIGATGALKMAFQLARDLGPCILFMEDIDNWLYDGATDLLKTEMDGIHENKGLITVLTSNNPEKLPNALLDRPGRFHEILMFDLPNESVRKDMLITWLGTEIESEKLSMLLAETDGFSGAYMKELVDYAHAIAEDEELPLVDALVKSLQKVKEQRELVQTIRQTTKSFDTIEIKEGRVISKKNKKKLEEARDAIDQVLKIAEIQETDEEAPAPQVLGLKDFTPEKKEVKVAPKRKITEREITLLTLQKIAKVANEGLHEAKKRK